MAGAAFRFSDRMEAGEKPVDALPRYAGRSDVLVLALQRGGVPDSAPGRPMGAIAGIVRRSSTGKSSGCGISARPGWNSHCQGAC